MPTVSITNLYKKCADALALDWVAGHQGGQRCVVLDTEQKLANIGYLNLIHPHQIQVIGLYELAYLDALGKNSYQDAIAQLFDNQNFACIVLVDCNNLPIFQDLRHYANKHNIALFISQFTGEYVINYLHALFAQILAQRITLHGVFMDVLGVGVLIMGDSGTGKSELALELVSRGHRLVADDATDFCRITPTILSGSSPLNMTSFLEVRGLGILNVQALFGDSAIKRDKYLRLVVQLEHMTAERIQQIDRLQGDYRIRNILGVDVPEISLPIAPGRSLAVLLECAVRNHSLREQGYNAADDFCEQQRQAMYRNEQHDFDIPELDE